MKIAVPYDNGVVSQHFGKSEQFKIYTIADFVVTSTEILTVVCGGHNNIADFLAMNMVNCVICGGIGSGAVNALGRYGIEVCASVKGVCDEAVNKWLDGSLIYSTVLMCNHNTDNCSGSCSSCT